MPVQWTSAILGAEGLRLGGVQPTPEETQGVLDEAIVRWACELADPEAVARARELADGHPLAEALVLHDVLGLADVMELEEASASMACAPCGWTFDAPAPLVAHVQAVPCPACGGAIALAEACGVGASGAGDQRAFADQATRAWAVQVAGLTEEAVDDAAAAADDVPLAEALVRADLIDLVDLMEALEHEEQVTCGGCSAVFTAGAGLLEATGLTCPECGGRSGRPGPPPPASSSCPPCRSPT